MKRSMLVLVTLALGVVLALVVPHFSAVGQYPPVGSYSQTPAPAPTPSDRTPPDTTITSEAPGKKDRTPTFEFESSESGSRFECSVDVSSFDSCDSPFTTDQLSKGEHSFEVRAIDRAGNIDPSPAGVDFKVKKKKGNGGNHHHKPKP